MERYTRIFSLPTNLYAEGSLVILEAGALLKDNANNTMLAQLKFKNVNSKAIKMLKVEIISKDSMGRNLEPATAYQYLDLCVYRDDSFGSQQAIALPDNTVRSFDVKVLEIGLEDNSIVKGTDAKWKVLPYPEKLESSELSKQCRIAYGDDFWYKAAEYSDLWYCSCGALNRKDEDACHKCDRPFKTLSGSDIQELTAAMEQRLLEEERQHTLEEEQRQIEAKKAEEAREIAEINRRKKHKKICKMAAAICILAAVAICIGLYLKKSMALKNNYNSAVSFLEAENYDNAIAMFSSLGDYKDSVEKLRIAEHEKEMYLQEQKNAQKYETAISLISDGISYNDEEAYTIFTELGDYKDSQQRLKSFRQMLISEERITLPDNETSATTLYSYSQEGNLISEDHTSNKSRYTIRYTYNSDNQLVEIYDSSAEWRTQELTYKNGVLVQTKYPWSKTVSTGEITYTTVTYDENGMPKTFVTNGDWKDENVVYHPTVSEEGKMTSLTVVDMLHGEKAITLNFDDGLNYSFVTPCFSSKKELRAFDEENNIEYIYFIESNKPNYLELYETTWYDEYGKPAKQSTYFGKGEYKYYYNDENQLIKQVKYVEGKECVEDIYQYAHICVS